MKILKPFLFLVILSVLSCEKNQLENGCVEAMIPQNIVYKIKYGDCYPKSIWVEVLSDKNIGKDVTIYHAHPVLHPIEPDKYFNIVELVFTDDFIANHPIEELAGKRIYFEYRDPTEEEIKTVHPNQCGDNVYEVYQTPVMIATDWSFENCPSLH